MTTYTRFVIKEAALIAAFNAGVNALYTWWLWRLLDPLTLFAENGVGLDLATTPVFIGFVSTLLGTASLRRRLADGRVAAGTRAPPALRLLPRSIAARSAVMAVGCGLALGSPLWTVLQLDANAALTLAEAIGTKVAITIALSLVIVPVVIATALADVQREDARVATV